MQSIGGGVEGLGTLVTSEWFSFSPPVLEAIPTECGPALDAEALIFLVPPPGSQHTGL